MQTERIMLQTS